MSAAITEGLSRPGAGQVNETSHRQAEVNVARCAADPAAIDRRLAELDREWDVERTLGALGAAASLAGLGLARGGGRRWLVLPALAAGVLLQQAVQGWSPAAPLLRRWGFRSAREVDHERYALKALRGDFQNLPPSPGLSDRAPVSRVLHAVEH